MQQAAPDRRLIDAPTAADGATCRSCATCPWMAMTTLPRLLQSLEQATNEILVPEELIPAAVRPLQRMLAFTANLNRCWVASGRDQGPGQTRHADSETL